MTIEEFREEMLAFRASADEEARAAKDPYVRVIRLNGLYVRFDDAERRMADQVLCEWALSAEPALRGDAQSLIYDFRIASAIPALHQLAARLAASTKVGERDELEYVRRILARLGDS